MKSPENEPKICHVGEKIIIIEKPTKFKTIKQCCPISLLTSYYSVFSNIWITKIQYACTFNSIIPDSVIAFKKGHDPSENL